MDNHILYKCLVAFTYTFTIYITYIDNTYKFTYYIKKIVCGTLGLLTVQNSKRIYARTVGKPVQNVMLPDALNLVA